MSKPLLLVVVAVLLIGGGWWYLSQNQSPAGYAPPAPVAKNTNISNTQKTAGTQATASNSTDAYLNNDLSGVDAQMASLDKDNSSVDQSMNDKPVAQDSF